MKLHNKIPRGIRRFNIKVSVSERIPEVAYIVGDIDRCARKVAVVFGKQQQRAPQVVVALINIDNIDCKKLHKNDCYQSNKGNSNEFPLKLFQHLISSSV